MANRTEYQIVGRYMNGKEVTGYHLQSVESGKNNRYTKEQVCFLVGKGQVTNCSGQIYQDKVLLRGVGISLEDLPVQKEDGSLARTDSIGKVRRGATAADAMTQYMVTTAIINGRNVIGYIVANAGGGTNKVTREALMKLSKDGRVGNVRYQESNGKPILRGVGINLNELPTITAVEAGITVPANTQTNTVKQPNAKQPMNNIEKFKMLAEQSLAWANKAKVGIEFRCTAESGKVEFDDSEEMISMYFNVAGKDSGSYGGGIYFEKARNKVEFIVINPVEPGGESPQVSVPLTVDGFKEGWRLALKYAKLEGAWSY